MQFKKIILAGIFVIICAVSCDKHQADCTPENPLVELEWLANLVDGFESNSQLDGVQIVQYTYQGSSVFLVDTCVGCADGISSVYNCDGDVICEFGGIDGRNTCTDFEGATDERYIYSSICGDHVIVDETKYDSETAFYSIQSAVVTGFCLEIEFSSSGCSGDSWTWEMIDAGVILESFPPQRNFKLILENNESCQAVFTKKATFELTHLALSSYSEVKINLKNWDTQLVFSH
ncbi:MAG: hypothetical protein ABJP45_15485 [Cyclobacteriaceae bacterium]